MPLNENPIELTDADLMPDDQAPDDTPKGGLGALSSRSPVPSASAPALSGISQITKLLASGAGADPDYKWNSLAAGMFAPTHGGGLSESISNGLGGYAKAQEKEAELKAQYVPMVVQHLMTAQLQQYQMAQKQFSINRDHEKVMNNGLVGMLSDPKSLTYSAATSRIGDMVERGLVPYDVAASFAANLPKDPEALKKHIMSGGISQQNPEQAVGSVTQKPEFKQTGKSLTALNTNPNAGPVGPITGAPQVPMGLTASEDLPKTMETPAGPAIFKPSTGQVAPLGTSQAGQVATGGPGIGSGPTPSDSMGSDPGAGSGPLPAGSGAAPGDPILPPPPFGVKPPQQIYQEKVPAEFMKYEDSVTKRASAFQNVMARAQEIRDIASKTRAGATRPELVNLAGHVKDLATTFGVDPSRAQGWADSIAGGDLSAAREMQKLAARGAMQDLKTDMDAGRISQSEYQAYLKNAADIGQDPGASERLYNMASKDFNTVQAQQQFINKKKTIPGYDLSQLPAQWLGEAQKQGFIKPTVSNNTFRGNQTKGPAASFDVGISKSGKSIYKEQGTNQWQYGEPPK